MRKVLIDDVLIELTDEEFEKQFPMDIAPTSSVPPLEKRVAALESAIVDLALSNLEVVNNA